MAGPARAITGPLRLSSIRHSSWKHAPRLTATLITLSFVFAPQAHVLLLFLSFAFVKPDPSHESETSVPLHPDDTLAMCQETYLLPGFPLFLQVATGSLSCVNKVQK
ncbi:hypothetical protein LSTR_LSTR017009 [Laodelphax striatellus]|uniref:Uncharacterized protein n=1 Tax=Laodelphax striatellus TaxID=195883 RepID=A0A482WJ45_LAOST|nr:hypothetical protein LSTR_LSTR017009 [Laodelphax striatellus]